MKKLSKQTKSTIIKSLILVGIIAIIAVSAYFILRACGFTTVEDFNRLRDDLGDSFTFWLVITLLQIIQVVFIPITNQIVTVPVALIFKNELWKVFLSSWAGIFLGSIALYFIGRYGGRKILGWILSDKEKAERCSNWMNKGKAFYPMGMLIPFVPDDVLTTLAGTAKFKFWYVLSVVAVTRGICCAFSVWGWGYLTQFWWGWIILAVGLVGLLALTYLLFKKMSNSGKNQKNNA